VRKFKWLVYKPVLVCLEPTLVALIQQVFSTTSTVRYNAKLEFPGSWVKWGLKIHESFYCVTLLSGSYIFLSLVFTCWSFPVWHNTLIASGCRFGSRVSSLQVTEVVLLSNVGTPNSILTWPFLAEKGTMSFFNSKSVSLKRCRKECSLEPSPFVWESYKCHELHLIAFGSSLFSK